MNTDNTPTGGFIPPHGGYRNLLSFKKSEIVYDGTNTMITLINITTYLLNQQIKQLEIAFVTEGGLKERMTKARLEERNKNK